MKNITTEYINLLLLGLFFLVSTSMVVAYRGTTQEQRNIAATVNIINGQAVASDVSCSDGTLPQTRLEAGKELKWDVGTRALVNCGAVKELRYFAAWHAYERTRDKKNSTVFWLLKDDGIFLSWDELKWIKDAEWETE